jgi:hypothetical protein
MSTLELSQPGLNPLCVSAGIAELPCRPTVSSSADTAALWAGRQRRLLGGLHSITDAVVDESSAIGAATIWQWLADGYGTTNTYSAARAPEVPLCPMRDRGGGLPRPNLSAFLCRR